MSGTVKWFDTSRGYGFILNPEGKDVFVHYSSIEGDGFRMLNDGEKVEYEQIEGPKGLHALNVRRLDPRPRPKKRDLPPRRGMPPRPARVRS